MRWDRSSKQESGKSLYAVLGVAALVILFNSGVVGLLLVLPIAVVVLMVTAAKKSGKSGPEAGGGWAALKDREQLRRSVQDARAVIKQKLELRNGESTGPARRRESAELHDHIPSTALNTQKRLEQLKTLKGAGLYTPQEYEAKRRQILAEK